MYRMGAFAAYIFLLYRGLMERNLGIYLVPDKEDITVNESITECWKDNS